jgi:receptor-type tyrosine-protein phosphatase gamma
VTFVSEQAMANYTLRHLRLKHSKLKKKKWICSERNVAQYHYTAWPDHGTPADTLPVLSFIRKSVAASPTPAEGRVGKNPVKKKKTAQWFFWVFLIFLCFSFFFIYLPRRESF